MEACFLKHLKTGKELALPLSGRVLVGRSRECALRLKGNVVSRRHCELVVGEEVVIRDLGSRTGTFVNQVQIEGDCKLKNGDEVRIGAARFLFLAEAKHGTKDDAVGDTQDDLPKLPETATLDDNDAYFESLLRELKALRDGDSTQPVAGVPTAAAEPSHEVSQAVEKPRGDESSTQDASGSGRSGKSSDARSSAESARDAIEKHFRRLL